MRLMLFLAGWSLLGGGLYRGRVSSAMAGMFLMAAAVIGP